MLLICSVCVAYRHLHVHVAVGEAEAECCHLQRLGLVDAVWSQDSDCLMFGCGLWVRDYRTPKDEGFDNRNKAHTKKTAKYVRVVRTEALQIDPEHRLSREGCVLFAMLAGGDYGNGLWGCGADNALKVVQRGLGRNLCTLKNQNDCKAWRGRLATIFKIENINIAIPDNFPDFKTLQLYNTPKVHSETVLRANPELQIHYRRTVHEEALLLVTSHRFNLWGRGYMDWIVPTMLTRFFADRDGSLPPQHVHHIEMVIKQKKELTDSKQLEKKLKFSPFGLTELREHFFRVRKRGYWRNGHSEWFDPHHKVECEIPAYLLEKVLPRAILEPPILSKQPRSSKQKLQEENRDSSSVKKDCNAENTSLRPSPLLLEVKNGVIDAREPSRAHQLSAYGGETNPQVAMDDVTEQENRDLQLALAMSLEKHKRKAHAPATAAKAPVIIDLTNL